MSTQTPAAPLLERPWPQLVPPGPVPPALALWVGIEPTLSRVGDDRLDQLSLTGVDRRPDDMDRLASLGAAAARFPLLWERTAPTSLARADWRYSDVRLGRLQALGVTPIVGLVHHGSGPLHTHLLDPEFVPGLVAYARAVAERYPQVGAYTPVNEPLTTARFSALYGHWYPHASDERSFWTALRHQLQATVLAMQAIRQVNPQAQLVQTEDLGRSFSTPRLGAQADFENERRWLTFDLLLGRVDEAHPLWDYLRRIGATDREVLWFAEHPCAPELLGINTYVTGERFLDDRLDAYPASSHGGNGREDYADVEAVRVRGRLHGGAGDRLSEAHGRYGRPLAITEAHLNCTREEQLRWLLEVWQGAQEARRTGADVRAVTAWAAFGAYEWNSLLTRRSGHYESGLWDVRAPRPRPTALVQLVRELAAERPPSHPVLAGPGWWQRRERLIYPPVGPVQAREVAGRPLLISAGGPLGRALAWACDQRGLPWRPARPADLRGEALERLQPWAVIHSAALDVASDADAEQSPEGAGLQALIAACAREALPLLSFSSAEVFGDWRGAAAVESDPACPRSDAGHRLRAAEQAALRALPTALVVRPGQLFSPWSTDHFPASVCRRLRAGQRVQVAAGGLLSPTYLPDLIHAALDGLVDGERGIWHLSPEPALSPLEFARLLARLGGLDETLIEEVAVGEGAEPCGGWSAGPALRSERGWPLPSLDDAVRRWLAATGH